MYPKTRVLSRYLGKEYTDLHTKVRVSDLTDLKYYGYSGTCYFDINGVPNPAAVRAYMGENIINPYITGQSLRNVTIAWNRNNSGVQIFDSSLNRKPTFNNCRNYKDQLVNLPYAYLIKQYNSNYNGYYKPYGREADYSSVSQVLASADFGMYDAASRRGWWTMQPRFEGEVQMLNFLFELKDFKNIAKAMTHLRSPALIAERMRSLRNSLRRIPGKILDATATGASTMKHAAIVSKKSIEVAAELRLAYSFALVPLILDLGAILAQAGQIVREVQAQFKALGEELQVRHYSETDVIKDTLVSGSNNNYWKASGIHEKRVFTATLEYGYNYTMREQSDAFLRYWGLQLTPEAIWNAIPFSFLIDYFYKVGDSIHSMSVDPNIKLMPSQYCESLLSRYSSGISSSGDPRANLLVDGKIVGRGDIICGHTGSLYQRRVVAPNKGLATPRLRLPSGGQGINMAALAVCFI